MQVQVKHLLSPAVPDMEPELIPVYPVPIRKLLGFVDEHRRHMERLLG